MQDSEDPVTQDLVNENVSSESLCLLPVDPSPGREADRSTSVTLSFPISSAEGCVATSTPEEEGERGEILGSITSTASISVGYGGECEGGVEEGNAEKTPPIVTECGKIMKCETSEGRDEFGDDTQEGMEVHVAAVVCGEEHEDTDATLGDSVLNSGGEEEEAKRGTEDPLSMLSSASWHLMCSSSSNTKSSSPVGEPLVQRTILQIDSQWTDSLPDSEVPLVIDIPESQSSQATDTNPVAGVLTAVAQPAHRYCGQVEKAGAVEGREVQTVVGQGKEFDSSVRDGRKLGGGGGGGERRDGLIKEAWKLLYQDKMNESVRSKSILAPPSPLKSQQTSQLENDAEVVKMEQLSDAMESSSQAAFSLQLSQSQSETTPTEAKATPTTTDGAITDVLYPSGRVPQERGAEGTQGAGESTAAALACSEELPHTVSDQRESREEAGVGGGVGVSVVVKAHPAAPIYESVPLEESSSPFQCSPLPPTHHQQPSQQQQAGLPPHVSTCSQISQTSSSSAGKYTCTS